MRFLLSIKDGLPQAGRQGLVRRPARGASPDFRRRREGRLRLHGSGPGRGGQPVASRGLREPDNDHLLSRHRAGRYQAMLPTFIAGWDGRALKARVAFGAPDQETVVPPDTALERRYALRTVKQRLHQASSPPTTAAARCRDCRNHYCSMPPSRWFRMASRSRKIHHAAFDAHLIGIDPDYRLHVSERLPGYRAPTATAVLPLS
jgi:putative restriction endonuclease